MFGRNKLLNNYIIFAIALYSIGLLSRSIPLLNIDGRLLQQFPTEDGYLMLTIARNLALGMGMSTAEGTIATNGTQPFMSFLYAIGYYITSGDKTNGVVFAHIVQLVAAILTAIVLYKLCKKIFQKHHFRNEIAIIVSAVFFSSPHILPHSINFLETGMYLLVITIVMYVFYETEEQARSLWSLRKSCAVGLLLGWMFWVRIDSVFIILAVCITHLFYGVPHGADQLKGRFLRTLVFGGISVLVALPWLVYNKTQFGSFTPVSGQSQDARVLGETLIAVPGVLLEYIMVMFPIPQNIQLNPIIVALSTVGILSAVVIAVLMWKKSRHHHRGLMLMGFIVVCCFVTYYGVFFGAKHFMARYLSVLAPFFILFTATTIAYILTKGPTMVNNVTVPFAVLVLIISISLNVRLYIKGIPHQHFQVVQWVENNVSEDTWLGAIQTGTLGYFHDRTINLDGKVNPEALFAKQGLAYCSEIDGHSTIARESNEHSGKSTRNCLGEYILGTEIQYLADWTGIATWMEILPLVADNFELVVYDNNTNLGVLKRHDNISGTL